MFLDNKPDERTPGAAAQETLQFLNFTLGREVCAIPLLGVKEIIEYNEITPIPAMPAFVHGVVNLRGTVVPVLDLSLRLGGPAVTVGERTCIVIVEMHEGDLTQDMGLIVDCVSAVSNISPADIEPPPAFGARIRVDFIQGMWKKDNRFIIVLNTNKVLSMAEIISLASDIGDAHQWHQSTGHSQQ